MKAKIVLPNGTIIEIENGTAEEIRRLAEPHSLPVPVWPLWPQPANPFQPTIICTLDGQLSGMAKLQMDEQMKKQGYLPVLSYNAEGFPAAEPTGSYIRFENLADPRARTATVTTVGTGG
jgi:hypothetical protein